MVKTISGLTGSGMKDWYIQRLTAFILLLYVIFLVVFCVSHSPVNYLVWHDLFSQLWVKIFTLLAAFSMIFHAWVGIWTIFTDYIHCSKLRGTLMTLVTIAFFAMIVWSIVILWG